MAGRRTILMVEDETSITEPLAEALDREGFDTRVAGTVADVGWGPVVPCTSSPSNTIGSTCALTSSFNALIPGSVQSGARSIWELGQVSVFDGGPDGDGDTVSDNTPFLRQGIFVP